MCRLHNYDCKCFDSLVRTSPMDILKKCMHFFPGSSTDLNKFIIKMGQNKTNYSIKNSFRFIVLVLVHVIFCSIKGGRGNLSIEI